MRKGLWAGEGQGQRNAPHIPYNIIKLLYNILQSGNQFYKAVTNLVLTRFALPQTHKEACGNWHLLSTIGLWFGLQPFPFQGTQKSHSLLPYQLL